MLFTDKKIETLRSATAQSRLTLAPQTLARLTANELPKQDVIPLARAAGVMAAKKTPDLIPYCHPLTLDGVSIEFEFGDTFIVVTASVKSISRTGVEMEALTAASVTALTLYDMLKPIDKNMEITSIKLMSKKGGKSDFIESIPNGFSAAVIVTSDGTHAGIREDKSGKIICERLSQLNIPISHYIVLPDDRDQIAHTLRSLCESKVSLIVTTGGTGLGPRDVTVEAASTIIEREIPGIAEAMRRHGQSRTPYAMLSRGIAGVRGTTLIITLPGSSKGVDESMDALFPAVLHLYPMMAGGGHEPKPKKEILE